MLMTPPAVPVVFLLLPQEISSNDTIMIVWKKRTDRISSDYHKIKIKFYFFNVETTRIIDGIIS